MVNKVTLQISRAIKSHDPSSRESCVELQLKAATFTATGLATERWFRNQGNSSRSSSSTTTTTPAAAATTTTATATTTTTSATTTAEAPACAWLHSSLPDISVHQMFRSAGRNTEMHALTLMGMRSVPHSVILWGSFLVQVS